MWLMILTFLITVVVSTVIALEYARIDSISVDYKVEEFKRCALWEIQRVSVHGIMRADA